MAGLDIEKLKELQSVLTRKIEISAKMNDIPSNLATKRELLNRIQKNYTQNSERYDQIQKELATARTELYEAEQMRERSEMRMGEISTQREYEMLDKEIRSITDREIKIKEFIEQLKNDLAQHKERVEREKELIKIQEDELKSEEQRVKKDTQHYTEVLEKLSQEEKKITPSFDDEFLYKFQRIIKSLEGEGIVPLVTNVCSSCHMILPYSFANAVRQNNEILFCPYCSKVLYYVSDENATNSSDSYADIIESFDDEMVQDMEVNVSFDEVPLELGSDDEDSESITSDNDAIIEDDEGEQEDSEDSVVDSSDDKDENSDTFAYDEDTSGDEPLAFTSENDAITTITDGEDQS